MPSISDHSISNDSFFAKIENLIPDHIGSYQPDIFPLGYFAKRSEPRLLYVMPLTMIYEGKKYSVKSKNISPSGLQIFIPRTFIQEGKSVQISFDKFIQSQNSIIGGSDELTPFDSIAYTIKEVKHVGEKTYISLIQDSLPPTTMAFIKRFIDANRQRYKIDAFDQICASKAQYYENLYSVNMQHIPMFIHWSQDSGFYIDTMIKTERNKDFFNYISHHSNSQKQIRSEPQFNAFCIPERIEKFSDMARNNESAIFFTYWEQDVFCSVFDFELQSSSEIYHIVEKVKKCQGRIYSCSTNLNKKPTAEKITALLSQIQRIDSTASKDIDKRASESIAQVMFTDVTQNFFRQHLFSKSLEFNPGQALNIYVISNNNKIRMSDGQVIKTFDDTLFRLPDIVNFTTDQHRYDPRYQYEMDVSIKYKHQVYAAKTIDFSRTGIGLIIHQDANIAKNSIIEITFSSLIIKGVSTQLNDITHRVVNTRKNNDGLFLGVVRNTRECHRSINQFFSKLVIRNKAKLDLCVKDKIDTVNTTFFEAFVTENIQTIPVIISRDKNKHHYIREIGLTETPCRLAEKLYIDGHGYDFRFLTTELRLNEFYERAIKASDKNPQSFMLFLFIKENEFAQKSIFSITDFELIQQDQIELLVNYILKNNGVCIKVKFMNNLIVDKLYRNMTLDKVDKLNRSSGRLLAQEYNEIIGFAELIDLTHEYRKLYK